MPTRSIQSRPRPARPVAARYVADIAVFDPATIQDHATFENSRQTATGVSEVINGTEVVQYGEDTGAKPGRVVRCERN